MPQPDSVRRPRDARIDALRGLALVMIFVDHVPGNPYENYTLRNWGFSDAAEGFFVMSGIAAALAYSGRFAPDAVARKGLAPAVVPMWKRAWVLYLTHLFLTFCAIVIFISGSGAFGMPAMLQEINLGPLFEAPGEVLLGLTALTHQFGYVNILPAYSVLLLLAPAAMYLGVRSPSLLLAGALFVWFVTGLYRLNMPNYPGEGGWFFNPFAWQLVFAVGMLIGLAMKRGERFVPRSPVLFALAVGWLALAASWKLSPALAEYMDHQMFRLSELGAPFHFISHDKTFVALPRLLHVLSLVYVLSCLPLVSYLSAHPAAAPLRMMGRQGLQVFASGTLISLLFQVIMMGAPDAVWLGCVLPILGIVAMLVVAWVYERNKPAPEPRRKRAAQPA